MKEHIIERVDYLFTIDYSKTLDEMMDGCLPLYRSSISGYLGDTAQVGNETFPHHPYEKTADLEVMFIRIKTEEGSATKVASEVVGTVNKSEERKWRMAGLCELLALASQYLDLLKEHNIVAMMQVYGGKYVRVRGGSPMMGYAERWGHNYLCTTETRRGFSWSYNNRIMLIREK